MNVEGRLLVSRLASPLCLSLLISVSGCHKRTNVAAEKTQGAVSAVKANLGQAPDTIPQGATEQAVSDHFTAQQFDVAIKPSGAYKSGQPSAVLIALNAKVPYHCNPKYPYKFKLESTPGIQFPSPIVHKDAVQVAGSHATMTVKFTPRTTGKKTIAGKFSFSVCSSDKCLVERRNLKLDIDVGQ